MLSLLEDSPDFPEIDVDSTIQCVTAWRMRRIVGQHKEACVELFGGKSRSMKVSYLA